MEITPLLTISIAAALQAGNAIIDVYHSDYAVEYKEDDSPLTLADQKSHEIISEMLGKTDIPILSEEGREIAYAERKQWETLWIVDPLDGTKEFIKRNGEFTVNIALVKNHVPILGVVLVPATSRLYYGAEGLGAGKADVSDLLQEMAEGRISNADMYARVRNGSVPLPLKHRPEGSAYHIVGSRSHSTPELQAYVEQKKKEYPAVEFLSAGSSLKFCLVAEGEADVYPRLGPTMEWDTAAGQAVAEQSGCRVVVWDTGIPLAYNREDLLNPYFVVSRSR